MQHSPTLPTSPPSAAIDDKDSVASSADDAAGLPIKRFAVAKIHHKYHYVQVRVLELSPTTLRNCRPSAHKRCKKMHRADWNDAELRSRTEKERKRREKTFSLLDIDRIDVYPRGRTFAIHIAGDHVYFYSCKHYLHVVSCIHQQVFRMRRVAAAVSNVHSAAQSTALLSRLFFGRVRLQYDVMEEPVLVSPSGVVLRNQILFLLRKRKRGDYSQLLKAQLRVWDRLFRGRPSVAMLAELRATLDRVNQALTGALATKYTSRMPLFTGRVNCFFPRVVFERDRIAEAVEDVLQLIVFGDGGGNGGGAGSVRECCLDTLRAALAEQQSAFATRLGVMVGWHPGRFGVRHRLLTVPIHLVAAELPALEGLPTPLQAARALSKAVMQIEILVRMHTERSAPSDSLSLAALPTPVLLSAFMQDTLTTAMGPSAKTPPPSSAECSSRTGFALDMGFAAPHRCVVPAEVHRGQARGDDGNDDDEDSFTTADILAVLIWAIVRSQMADAYALQMWVHALVPQLQVPPACDLFDQALTWITGCPLQ